MPSSRTPITKGMIEVAELAAGIPDREGELLRRGFETLADSLPSSFAAFLELEGESVVVRAVSGQAPPASAGRNPRTPAGELPTLLGLLERRDCVLIEGDDIRKEAARALGDPGALSSGGQTLLVPVVAGEQRIGLLLFHHADGEVYGSSVQRIASLFGKLLGLGILATRQADEVEQYRQTLEERNRLLVEEVAAETDACLLIEEVAAETDACHALECAKSRVMRRLVRMAKQVAVTDAPVLITGETGTGKEVVARAIHAWSPRAEGPFVQINCAALPENLIESELFGHKKGAFSGATADRPGRFRAAHGGTILLDEIGDLTSSMQVKLLRVLQEGAFEPVGLDRTVHVDVRVIAATNVDLERAVDEGRFREDLYYRLHVFPLNVPPLRERRDDLEALVAHLLQRTAKRTGRGPWTISERAMRRMAEYAWPGNVRELVNTLERARVASPLGGRLEIVFPERLAKRKRRRRGEGWVTLQQHERDYIERVLVETGGKIYGEGGAAQLLGLPPTTLQSRMRRHGLRAKDFRGSG
jgi:transcriptional regulator with GAF, ATPase, and Fis domain